MSPTSHWLTLTIRLTTITELPEYIRRANELLSEAERKAVINYLAAPPLDGDIMEGTGGIRKLRWASGGKGKSGGGMHKLNHRPRKTLNFKTPHEVFFPEKERDAA